MGARRPLPPRSTLARRPRRRLTTTLRRQPVVFWFLTLVAAAGTYLLVHSALSAASEGAQAYGSLVPVVVAVNDLDAGATVGRDDVRVTELPAALIPVDVVSGDPIGRVVRHPIGAGEAVLDRRLGPDGAVGIAAMLGDGERAVAIPLPPHRAPIQVGQLVDVLATFDPDLARGRNPTSVVAEAAVVVAVDEGGVTVAATATDAVRIATALSTAVVSVAIAG